MSSYPSPQVVELQLAHWETNRIALAMRQKVLGSEASHLEPSELFQSPDPAALMSAMRRDQEIVTQLQVKQGFVELPVNEKLAILQRFPHQPPPPSPTTPPSVTKPSSLPIPTMPPIATRNGHNGTTSTQEVAQFQIDGPTAGIRVVEFFQSTVQFGQRIFFLVVTLALLTLYGQHPAFQGDRFHVS